jgi:hypothetical protein
MKYGIIGTTLGVFCLAACAVLFFPLGLLIAAFGAFEIFKKAPARLIQTAIFPCPVCSKTIVTNRPIVICPHCSQAGHVHEVTVVNPVYIN